MYTYLKGRGILKECVCIYEPELELYQLKKLCNKIVKLLGTCTI